MIYSFQTVSSCFNWTKDNKFIACEAVCQFYNDFLNDHRKEQTCTAIATCLSSLSPYVSYLSVLTTQCKKSSIQLLLKLILVCSSRNDLHKYQITFLQNGSFLSHLYSAIQNESAMNTFSREFVMACISDSAEGYRVLTRIFPTPITKQLDISTGSMKLKSVSYKDPIVDDSADLELLDNMSLTTVFKPLKANWKDFWKCLSMESQNYNFIWNSEMRECLLAGIRSELEDIRIQKEKATVSWDYDGFRILYPQLKEYICVDGYYLQQMIDVFAGVEEDAASKVELIKPTEFIRHLCDSFIVSRDIEEMRSIFYLIYQVVKSEEEARKNFPILRYLCFLLDEEELDPGIEYYCLEILEIICNMQRNTEQFVDFGGLSRLSELLVCAIQYVVTKQPAVQIESVRYSVPPLSIRQMDRIHLIVRIMKHACDSMLRIRNELISEPVLSRLLRCVLLFRDEEIIKDILSILSVSLASPTKYQSTVYRSGLFRVLLSFSCGENGMIPEIAELLYKYHLGQEIADIQNSFDNANDIDLHVALNNTKDIEQRVELARKYSYLRFFLPVPLITCLTREGPIRFCEVFNSPKTISAEVIWDDECRSFLSTSLQSMLLPYLETITQNPSVDWSYSTPEPVIYETIEELLYVHYVFLECYCSPGVPLPSVVDAEGFLKDLVIELGKRLNMLLNSKGELNEFIYEDMFLILKSILKLITESRDIRKIDKEVFSTLGRCFAADLHIPNNQAIIMITFDIIIEALQPAAYGKPSSHHVYEAADANLINSLDLVLVHLTDESLATTLADENSTLAQIFTKTMTCISILSGKSTPHALESLTLNSSFIRHLIHFIILDNVEIYPAVSLQVLKAFVYFLQEEKLLDVAVSSGILIFTLYIVICHDGTTSRDIDIINTSVICIELLAGIGLSVVPPKTVMDALTQLLTPGLVKSLRAHHFLTDIRSQNIRTPLLIWNQEMAQQLLGLLENEIDSILDVSPTSVSYWNAQAFCHPDSYLHIYPNLENEIIVDEVFLLCFIEAPDTELMDPTPEHFLKALLAYIAHLENSQEVGFRQSLDVYTEHLQVSLESLLLLLQYYNELQPSFINDTNIQKLFALLRDNSIESSLQDVVLSLLEIGVSTPAGCNILTSIIPDLCVVLENRNVDTQTCVLQILTQFIKNDNSEVIHLIMSTSLILKLLDMFLLYEYDYDGSIQENAVHVLGLMMESTRGRVVEDYLIALFSPLFIRGNEKYAILQGCSEYPGEFIETVNSDCFAPTIYWNKETREDLLNFLRKEARSMQTSDIEYVYADTEVTKRFKNGRVTLNSQLIVENVFIYQYIDYPICKINPSLFVNGIIEELGKRLNTETASRKDREDFEALAEALSLFVKKNAKMDASLYTTILSFYIRIIRDNVEIAQDKIISTVEFMAKQPAGLEEFKRNNGVVSECSYVVDLLASSYRLNNQHGYAYRIAEIIRSVINKDESLLSTCYFAGGLFYGFYFIFNDVQGIDKKDTMAFVYLQIIQDLASAIPAAEKDVLEFTTPNFKDVLGDDASIVKRFLMKPHRYEVDISNARSWNDTSREAVKNVAKDMLSQISIETYMNENWNRMTPRFSMEDVISTWEAHTHPLTMSQRYSEESTAIKLRPSIIGRPSYSPPLPTADRNE